MPNHILLLLLFTGIGFSIVSRWFLRRQKRLRLECRTRIFLTNREPVFWTDTPENR